MSSLLSRGIWKLQVKGNLAIILESAKLMITQLRAVHEMMTSALDVHKLEVRKPDKSTKDPAHNTNVHGFPTLSD